MSERKPLPESGGTAQRDGATALRGIIYACLSAMVFVPFATASVKHLSTTYLTFEIVWVRALGQTAWMLLLFVPRHGWRIAVPNRPGQQFVRSGVLFIATVCFILGIREVALATGHVIGFASPLFIVAMSALWLGERVTPVRWIVVAMGFVGVVVVVRPGFGDGLPLAAGWLVAASICWAVVQILSRRIAAHDRSETTAIHTYVAALIGSTVALPFVSDFDFSPSATDWLAIAAVGLFGGIRHYFSIKAYELAPASVIAPFNYTELIGATAMGLVVFGTLPDAWTWAGATIIIAAGVYLARAEAGSRRG
jgi:drug/metabolite transporter (DMT)-like permease